MATGVVVKHQKRCAKGRDRSARCSCKPGPTFEAWIWDKQLGKKTYERFPTEAAAKKWRRDAEDQQERGALRPAPKKTLRELADEWLAAAEADPPTVLNRNGRPYKPSVLRCYRSDLRRFVYDDLGAVPLADIRRSDLQAVVDRLMGKGLSGSKVRNVIVPLAALFNYAVKRDLVAVNPTSSLDLPRGSEPRERAASPTEASALLAALPAADRPLWACAFYGGLRRGELRGLRWEDVDLAAGVIHVRRGWDDVVGEIAPKSRKGARDVPVTALLRDYLTEQKTRSGRDGADLVFGSTAETPFVPNTVRRRAVAAWVKENKRRKRRKLDPLVPIGLHECRHTFVSLMHTAQVPLERIGDYVGHSSSYMTDRYRHLIEGQAGEDAKRLDDLLALADTRVRLAQVAVAASPGQA